MDQLREAARGVNVPESLSAEPSPKSLRLRGGMERVVQGSSWDIVAAWRQNMGVYRTMVREGLDVDHAAGALFDMMEDMISQFESSAEAADGSVAGAKKNARKLAECNRQLESEGHRQEELRAEVQRLTALLTDVKEKVGKLMVEDIQRMK